MTIHPLDRPPEDDSTTAAGQRPARSSGARVIRVGVFILVGGIAGTAIGAGMLGQGPGSMEQFGDAIHRAGMLATLAGLFVIFMGYRWDAITALLVPPAPPPAGRDVYGVPLPETSVRQLFSSLAAPPNVPGSHGVVGSPAGTGATSSRVMAEEIGPSEHSTASPYEVPPVRRGQSPDSEGVGSGSAGGSPISASPPLVSPPPISPREQGCLVMAWACIGFVFVLGGIFFLIVPSLPAFLIAVFLDFLLAAALVACVCVTQGARRALFGGMLVSHFSILSMQVPYVHSQMMSMSMMGYGPMREDVRWKLIYIALHLMLPLGGGVAWIVGRTIELMSASRRRSGSA